MAGERDPAEAARRLTALLNAGLLAGAVCAVAAEGPDLDGDGEFTAHEALLVPVRLLAFPVHALLRVVPGPALEALGLAPDAPWPPSAAAAVALSVPLWGLLVCGALVLEARLAMALEGAARRRRRGAGTA